VSAENEPKFLDEVAKAYERWTGDEWSPEKTLVNFVKYGRAKRVVALEQIDRAVQAASTADLREYTRLTSLQRQVEDLHKRMTREGQ
jgi:hypothetical protein